MAKPITSSTKEHTGPRRTVQRRGREVLLVAFPEPRVLPVPIAGQAVGREWLTTHGLNDSRVSTSHIVFSRPGGGLFVEDLGSRNGTWLNGVRLAPKERVSIERGALVRIGRTLLVYRDAFLGDHLPSPPIGRLVGPFGLRGVEELLRAIVAHRPTNVLIEGETGTGKELVAHALAEGAGRGKTYAPVNVAGVAAGVFESQLFGYVPGAYSGSGRGSPGVFVAHDGGAVFLDEIGELPLDLQAKLLRVLDNREVLAVGAVKPVHIDVLVIAATNRLLEDAVAKGAFRQDLLARLAAARIALPPLRERAEDLYAIATALLAAHGTPLDAAQVEVEAVERLMLHAWPSNVRELASVLQRISMTDAPPRLRLEVVQQVLGPMARDLSDGATLTGETVQRALAKAGGNESEAARMLGVSRGKLRRFLDGKRGPPE